MLKRHRFLIPSALHSATLLRSIHSDNRAGQFFDTANQPHTNPPTPSSDPQPSSWQQLNAVENNSHVLPSRSASSSSLPNSLPKRPDKDERAAKASSSSPIQGQVLSWFDDKGFGFIIDPKESPDAKGHYRRQFFVHFRDLYFGEHNCLSKDFSGAKGRGDIRLHRGLNVGALVEFRKKPTSAENRKLAAHDVRSVGGGPLPPYEPKPLFDPNRHYVSRSGSRNNE